MTEKELQATLVEALQWGGWLTYHTYDSRRSQPGFPDIVAVSTRGTRRLLILELKSAKGRTTATQRQWLDLFDDLRCLIGDHRVRVGVLRPDKLERVLDWVTATAWDTAHKPLPIK